MDEEAVRGAVARRSSFNIIHRDSIFKVDVFLPSDSFSKKRFGRARAAIVSQSPEAKARVASPEDVLLAKLHWYRQGGEVSERQWRDAIGLVQVQAGGLDQSYLRQTAIELGVSDLLEKALKPSL